MQSFKVTSPKSFVEWTLRKGDRCYQSECPSMSQQESESLFRHPREKKWILGSLPFFLEIDLKPSHSKINWF